MNNEKLRAEILGVINTYPLSGNTELLNRCYVALGEQQSVPDGLRQVHGMILNALDRDAAEGKVSRGEMAQALRDALAAAPSPVQSVPDVLTMARVLSDRHAEQCNMHKDDNWKLYGQAYIDDVNAMLAAAPSAPAAQGWIPVGERLPEGERTVLAFYLNSHGKGRRVRAEYIAAKTKSADDGWDSDSPPDYDEQADEYFWPAGWYEVIDNWDDLTHLTIHEGTVTHWMPLPAAPAAQGGE